MMLMSKKMLAAICMGSYAISVHSLKADTISVAGKTSHDGNKIKDEDNPASSSSSTVSKNIPSTLVKNNLESSKKLTDIKVSCSNCGRKLSADARFCDMCGTPRHKETSAHPGNVSESVASGWHRNIHGVMSDSSQSGPQGISSISESSSIKFSRKTIRADLGPGFSNYKLNSDGVVSSRSKMASDRPHLSASSEDLGIEPIDEGQVSDSSDHEKFTKIGNYLSEKVLGEGGFGKVHLVRLADSNTSTKFALKEMKNMKESHRKALEKERNLLQKLKHEHIIQYIDAFTENNAFYIVLELANSGDLADHVQKQIKSKKQWSKWEICECFYQVVCGLDYLHTYRSDDVNGILHRDLKPQNILVCGPPDSKNLVFKIADFGLARVMEGTFASVATFAGTRVYMSPEALNEETYSFATDMWALGCILYELCTLKIAFSRPADVLQLKLGIENLPVAIPRISNSTSPHWEYWKGLSNICSEILDRDPNKRPTCRTLLQRMTELKLPAWLDVSNLTTKDDQGSTPLMRSIKERDIRTVRALMELPADDIGLKEENESKEPLQHPLKIFQLAVDLLDADPVVDNIEPGCSIKVIKMTGLSTNDIWKENLVGIIGEVVDKTVVDNVWRVKFHPADLRAHGVDPNLVLSDDSNLESVRYENRDAKSLAVTIGFYWKDVSRIFVKNRMGRTDLLRLNQSAWCVVFSFLVNRDNVISEDELVELTQREQEAARCRNYQRADDIKYSLARLRSLKRAQQDDVNQPLEESFIYLDMKEDDMQLIPPKVLRAHVVETLLKNSQVEWNLQDSAGNSALHVAVRQRSVLVVKAFLQRGVDVNALDSAGHTPLIWACHQGDEDVVHALLEVEETKVNICLPDTQWSALILACENDNVNIVRQLLARQEILADHSSANGTTALMVACRVGHVDIVRQLCNRSDVDINSISKTVPSEKWNCRQFSPLKYAAYFNHVAAVEELPKCPQIDVNTTDLVGWGALIMAADSGHDEVVSKFLVHPKINVNKVEKHGMTALIIAARQGYVAVVEKLLECEDIDVNHLSSQSKDAETYGWTALKFAAGHNHLSVVEALLKHETIDVNKCDVHGWNPLITSAHYGFPEMVKKLLDVQGIDVNHATKKHAKEQGLTALMVASRQGWLTKLQRHEERRECTNYFSVVEQLLQREEILVNAKDETYGHTALHWAAFKNDDPNIVRILLDHGSDYTIRNISIENTPLQLAAWENTNADIMKVFLEKASDIIDGRNKLGLTPLHDAATNNTAEVVEVMLNSGASIRALSNDANTPLHHAVSKQCWLWNPSTKRNEASSMSTDPAMVELFLTKIDGTNKDILVVKNKGGNTPLHLAAAKGDTDEDQLVVKKLKDCIKAHFPEDWLDKMTIENTKGKIPKTLAMDQGFRKVTKLLPKAEKKSIFKSFLGQSSS